MVPGDRFEALLDECVDWITGKPSRTLNVVPNVTQRTTERANVFRESIAIEYKGRFDAADLSPEERQDAFPSWAFVRVRPPTQNVAAKNHVDIGSINEHMRI
jgi:hypothetical protein